MLPHGQGCCLGTKASRSKVAGIVCRETLSHPERVTTFGTTLKDLMPALVKRKGGGGKTRRGIYLLPNLEQAREDFEQANKLHSIDWARDDDKLV